MVPAHLIDRLAELRADTRFRFEAKDHKYFLGMRLLTHFSEWMKEFKTPFDEQGNAQRMAREQQCDPQVFLDQWKYSREVIGTGSHNYIDAFVRGGAQAAPEHPDAEVQRRCGKFRDLYWRRLHQNFTHVASEQPIFDEATGYCGTPDWLAWHVKEQGLWVLDWKTNKRFARTGDTIWRKLLKYFADLPDQEQTYYSIQISFYRVLLERLGIATQGGAIVWLPPGTAQGTILAAHDYRERLRGLLV
jgi:hypothetical protein